MAVITIDGRQIEVTESKNILECALDAGIYIPHLCHHPSLNPIGSCRMCIVEAKGRGIVPSCELQAEDGLIVQTNSEEITRLRRLAMELLLTGHPEDCSTCPKYGSCELQTLIQYIGPKTGRLKTRTKGFQTEERNPLLIHDSNRCILCGRCVRICHDVRGVGVLHYQKKERESYVGTLHQMLLKEADCRFCGACAEVCPTGTIRDKLGEIAAVPCRQACPAHTDIPRYIRLIKEGKFEEAAAVIREKVPFPKTLGYICNHVCELECKRKEVSDSMSIRDLKRYAAEQDTGSCWMGKGKQLPDTGRTVCVVGAGPAGMTAAYYLRKQGHAVTIKEALPTAGGMTCYGIPSYRLPREIVAEEFAVIQEAGVKLEINTRVERPVDLLKQYDAVLMTIGSHAGVKLPIKGNDRLGVILNTDFLRKASRNEPTGIGRRVIVLGGGNVAFDCARTARRLGAEEIHLACLEAREAMTADEEEIVQAQEEGIWVHPALTFEAITGEEVVTGVDFMRVQSFTFDENRRAVIVKEEGSKLHMEADTVIFAVGQRPDLTEEAGLALGRGNCIAVKEGSLATSQLGIFAAGDAVYGTKSVIMAIESGREAAQEIDRYLGGDGDIEEKLAPVEEASPYLGREPGFGDRQRAAKQVLSPDQRQDNFQLVDRGICQEHICEEAGRCLQCDLRLQIQQPRLWGEYTEKTADGKGVSVG